MICHGFGATATNAAAIPPRSLSVISPSSRLWFSPQRRGISCCRIVASALPDDRIIVGCGGACMDYLVLVDSFPKPDDKIRSNSFKAQGGGNVGNALTCAARLGLKPRIITKVAADNEGKSLLEEFEADGVDTSFTVVSKDGRSMFSYVIVDSGMKTRTAIYNPGYPPMTPDDISNSALSAALDGAKLVYFDGLSLKTALAVAKEASRKGIPILVDAEMGEEGFESLLDMASYAVCSAKYPQIGHRIGRDPLEKCSGPRFLLAKGLRTMQIVGSDYDSAWTQAPSMATALISMLLKLPNLRFVIVTLGEDGCLMIERTQTEDPALEAVNVDQCLESLSKRASGSNVNQICVSSPVVKLLADGVGGLNGRLLVATAERIPPSELVDTTGAGDAFIGAVLYALCTGMAPEAMLPFACQVAAGCCRALGARTALPHHTDRRLAPFFHQTSGATPRT